jgi:hypothetical protein
MTRLENGTVMIASVSGIPVSFVGKKEPME